MQKRLYILVAVLGLSIFLMTSCGKDDPTPVTNKTKTDLIVQSPWKVEKVTVGGVDFTDNSAFLCAKDNITTFQANLTGSVNEGTNVCSPPAGNFTWQFKTGETILSLSAAIIPTGNNDFTIQSLTETNLVLSQSITVPVPANVVLTLKH